MRESAASLNTTRGRLIHDTAARLLDDVADRSNPLAIGDCIALAELRIKADALRRDPASDPLAVVRIEGLVDRNADLSHYCRARAKSPRNNDLTVSMSGLRLVLCDRLFT
jgi:hypothetical protein